MIKIVEDNILNFKGDAIVNAANSDLLAGGGVCGAIFHACGKEKLQKECDAIGHCNVGEAVITSSCDHKNVKYIIHAVAPRYGIDKNCPDLLYKAYYKALQVAVMNNVTSIAFPSLGTGIYGYPVKEASKIAIRAMRDILNVFDMDIYLYAFSHDDYLTYHIQEKMMKE